MRSRVELFTFPEQLPGPARFGKGCVMQSVTVTAAGYVREPLKAVQDLRDALAEFEQAYSASYFIDWGFSRNDQGDRSDIRICERLLFLFKCVKFARKREPELFGMLDPEKGTPPLLDWMYQFMWKAKENESFDLDQNPLSDLANKLQLLEFEILTDNRFVNPSPSNPTPPSANELPPGKKGNNPNYAILKASDPAANAFMYGKKWCEVNYAAQRFRLTASQLTKAATNAKGLFGVVVERRRAQVGNGKKGIQYVYHAGSLQLLSDAIGRVNEKRGKAPGNSRR